jgi:hypothetical protein
MGREREAAVPGRPRPTWRAVPGLAHVAVPCRGPAQVAVPGWARPK